MLKREDERESCFSWAWRPAMSWLLILLWLWGGMLLPLVNAAFHASITALSVADLVTFSGIWLAIYGGGHTVKDLRGQIRRDQDRGAVGRGMDVLDIALRIVVADHRPRVDGRSRSCSTGRPPGARNSTRSGTRIDGVADELDAHKEAGQESRARIRASGSAMSRNASTRCRARTTSTSWRIDVADMRGEINTQGETLKAVAATMQAGSKTIC